ncbi:PREDICTED: nucleoporin GLE1 [Polistes canadensis]|uniref:nucleoporin GLE1 n=1 Tax=Polistes canadensis TaxID=91411 RepID=UPI000718ACBC|nr:PREDICTED: nucleoporin GLE1 [Polistes canadensis]
MAHSIKNKKIMGTDMKDITADFACLKVSALGKALRISGEINRITIGPNSVSNQDEQKKLENIENEKNTCNVNKSPRKPIDECNSKNLTTRNGITFSIRKILHEEELQRREKVMKEVHRKWQHMADNGIAIQKHISVSLSNMVKERERKSAQKYADILAEEERLAEQEEIRRKHEQQLNAQRVQEHNEKMKRDIEEYKRKMQEKEDLITKILILRQEFAMKYYDIIMLSRNCKDKTILSNFSTTHSVVLRQLHRQIETLDGKIQVRDLVPTDLYNLETAIQQIKEISCLLKVALDTADVKNEIPESSTDEKNTNLNQKEPSKTEEVVTIYEPPTPEQTDYDVVDKNIDNNQVQDIVPETIPESVPETAQETTQEPIHEFVSEIVPEHDSETVPEHDSETVPEAAETLETTSNQQANSEDNSTLMSTVSLQEIEDNLYKYVDKESLQIYKESQEFLENYAKTYDEFLRSPDTKTFRFECQKAINIPVNAISVINAQHLKDKYEKLHNLLIGKSSPNVEQHPQGTAFCKDTLAKKIVSQGETLVSSKPEMAFAIAAVTVALWNEHADFGELLLAHFHQICPFTVPVFMPKIEGQTNEEYYKSLGYKYSEDGTVEKQDKFLKRMSGLMRLYISITVTSQRKGITKRHPHGLRYAWRWLAAILNRESHPNTLELCVTLILDVLEVAGNSLCNAYGKQFRKMLMLLANDIYPRVKNIDGISGGPLVRLEEFLKITLARGFIPPPNGYLPHNFW